MKLERFRVRLEPDVPVVKPKSPTAIVKQKRRRRAMILRKGMRVQVYWDPEHRGTIVAVGEEVSEMRLENSKETRFYPNEHFQLWKDD